MPRQYKQIHFVLGQIHIIEIIILLFDFKCLIFMINPNRACGSYVCRAEILEGISSKTVVLYNV